MVRSQSILGLPWALAKTRLQEEGIAYTAVYGASFSRFFDVADRGWYVARVQETPDSWQVLLYRPMIYSDFEKSTGVIYAKETIC